jgi:hypothetical protein
MKMQEDARKYVEQYLVCSKLGGLLLVTQLEHGLQTMHNMMNCCMMNNMIVAAMNTDGTFRVS